MNSSGAVARCWLRRAALLAHFPPSDSHDSGHGDFGNTDDLTEIVPFALAEIARVVIHGIGDPAITLKDGRSRETV